MSLFRFVTGMGEFAFICYVTGMDEFVFICNRNG